MSDFIQCAESTATSTLSITERMTKYIYIYHPKYREPEKYFMRNNFLPLPYTVLEEQKKNAKHKTELPGHSKREKDNAS